MTRARLIVEQAGPLTTVQDVGRFGHLRHGVTFSGPVEPLGFAAAHAALGNAPGAAAIEVSHGGIALVCREGAVRFALAGGDFTATLDDGVFRGRSLGSWTTGVLGAGARLVVRDGGHGNWATLAFAGSLDTPRWLGSAATLALAGLGGGRIEAGATIAIDAAVIGDGGEHAIPQPPGTSGAIRIVAGPQSQFFASETEALLTSADFTAGAAFDRMGLVLAGPPLPPLDLTMLSTPVIRGGIQVNGAGTATVLLADHQTTAGYPRLATVISADLPRLAQARPGARLRFVAVTAAEAVAIARAAAGERRAWLAQVADRRSLADRLMGSNLVDGVVSADI